MAGAAQPDLREFDPLVHEVLLFDEVHPQQVVAQKKLFQAPAVPVTLGQSPTNTLTYSVWVFQKKLVCCTNVWEEGLDKMSHEDVLWLQANSVVVHVGSKLHMNV